MNTPDLINGIYEFLGGFALWLNVKRLWKDKGYNGIHVLSTIFFLSWGYWNLYYYPHLDQWLSFIGGLNICAANTVWVALMLKFGRKK